MKSPIIIALTAAAVLGTAGAAVAVNAGTLAFTPAESVIGGTDVLVPTPTVTPSDSAAPAPVDGTDDHPAGDSSQSSQSGDDSLDRPLGDEDDSSDEHDDDDDSLHSPEDDQDEEHDGADEDDD